MFEILYIYILQSVKPNDSLTSSYIANLITFVTIGHEFGRSCFCSSCVFYARFMSPAYLSSKLSSNQRKYGKHIINTIKLIVVPT